MSTIPVYFSCLMCGLETDTVRLGSPSRRHDLVQAAFEKAAEPRPRWDASHVPHCPHCGGRLLLGESEHVVREVLESVLR